jgi:hypothetical protein
VLSQRWKILGLWLLAACCAAAPAFAGPIQGKLSGVVVDPGGIPQMGASVSIISEDARTTPPVQLLTNDRGTFSYDHLLPGLYSVRVTLAGFLPALERHVRVEANLSTLLKIELDSPFTSFDRLRRRPNQQQPDADEWAWVLRTSAATRPVLRWVDGQVLVGEERAAAESTSVQGPRGRIELTAGSSRPGSVSGSLDTPSSSFAYEQPLGRVNRLILAGQVNYERSGGAGFAATWLPAGDNVSGPRTTLALRQTNLRNGSADFRGIRMDHQGEISLGDRVQLRYGAEYIMVGLDRSASALRPRGELALVLAPAWRASLSLGWRPWRGGDAASSSALQSALETLDAFPAVMLRNGRPVLDGGQHAELALEHVLGPNTSIIASVFRDASPHTAVFGRGQVPSAEYFQDSFSDAFAYDGGGMNAWGARVAYNQKFSGQVETTVVYSWAGALSADDLAAAAELRNALVTRNRQSLGARIAGHVPRLGTQVAVSYKWINGPIVSRHDAFGEIAYQLEPNLNLIVRQPLPNFFFPGHIEAMADFRNLLAQGYVPVSMRDGNIVLMPALRSFRGGFSFQF